MRLYFSMRRLACIDGAAVGGPFTVATAILMLFLSVSPSLAAEDLEIQGELDWPEQWFVFTPLTERDPVLAADQLRTVPETLEFEATSSQPARSVERRTIEVTPGQRTGFSRFFESQRAGNVAYIFLKLNSPRAQRTTIGMGADWWLQVWVNGEEVYDTLDQGNASHPPTMFDHTMDIDLREGTNVLAVRYITGRTSSLIALGGPNDFAAAKAREAERLAQRDREDMLNAPPERFEDGLVFPVDEQATISADWIVRFPETNADLAAGGLAGLQPMPKRQLYRHGNRNHDTLNPRFDEPVRVRLSKYRYPWEDRHLDAMVWTTPTDEAAAPTGRLEVLLKDQAGEVLSHNVVESLSPNGLFFSVGFPPTLRGSAGALEVVWYDGDREVGRARAPFHVDAASGVAESGRVPLRIPNDPGATVAAAPMTVGVPFPRGALHDAAKVRLIDASGNEYPLQTRVTGKWSRFGSIKWLLCDFTVDLEGGPRELYLEYGPAVQRAAAEAIKVQSDDLGFPRIDAGRLRVTEDHLEYDTTGEGDYQPVLNIDALTGAYVAHEDAGRFLTPTDTAHHVEELGAQKVLLRRTGWYVHESTDERFCQFVTRLVFHRDSPIVRIYHTWIFTGNGNQDRIANMGWFFKTASEATEGAILSAFEDGQWIDASSLVQFDYEHYLLPDQQREHPGRTSGVASMRIGDARVTFGAKDFWQNFPSELAFEEGGFAFYNWPKRNPPPRFDRPVPVDEAFRLRFAHEGESLSFRMPDEFAKDPIWQTVTRGSPQAMHYQKGKPETANAQGVARTEEMFLHFASVETSADDAARVMQGLNDETLRAIVDPAWMTGSGVFGPIHPRDTERFAEEERLYDLAVSAPMHWPDRLRVYGMWVYGDYPSWNINLSKGVSQNYRAYKKMGHTYPYRAIPFVRTGEPRFLKLAENGTRQLTDMSFRHYASKDVAQSVGPDYASHRRQGWLTSMSMIPWALAQGPRNRGITTDSDFLWDTYYLTGYSRARDIALLFGELTKQSHMVVPATRHSQSTLKTYIDMYQATFDPWFLNSAHLMADMHRTAYGGDHEIDPLTSTPPNRMVGYDHWRAADQAYYAFTRDDDYESIARNSAIGYANPRMPVVRAGASHSGVAMYMHTAYAWHRTKEPFYLRRAASVLDFLRSTSYEGEPAYFQGPPLDSHGNIPNYIARSVPMVMAILADVTEPPDPVHVVTWLTPPLGTETFPATHVRHDGSGPLRLSLDVRGGGVTKEPIACRIDGPAGKVRIKETETSANNVNIDVSAGVYEVNVSGDFQLFLPMAMPDVPEVIEFDITDEGVATRGGALGYWFKVPEGVREFWIRYDTPTGGRRPLQRASVWNPDGERAWDRSFHNDDLPVEALVTVPEGQDGKLWRATGSNFEIDPQIPPYFSVSRTKWFDPME